MESLVSIIFNNIYHGKRVLITGHTGFKGTWLTSWLLRLNAIVAGISDGVPTKPSMFEELKISEKIESHIIDIRDLEKIKFIVKSFEPDFIFHLAAQSLVSVSYHDPIQTLSTNVLGTANILEALRMARFDCVAVIVTSDKCYENFEWVWGYKESDPLGGKDVYSASKGAAELVFNAYYHSFFKKSTSRVLIASGRAGNVIGGGDWAKDRIVADCARSWANGIAVEIRSPASTRPWQHVLEPLSGYLALGAELFRNRRLNGESFNFGPRSEQSKNVLELIQDLSGYWESFNSTTAYNVIPNSDYSEAGLLKLNCDKAIHLLKWRGSLNYRQCVKFTSEWYVNYYNRSKDMSSFTGQQIQDYEDIAKDRGLAWTQ
jgi:CDP-glucose 4,6-dehydratase